MLLTPGPYCTCTAYRHRYMYLYTTSSRSSTRVASAYGDLPCYRLQPVQCPERKELRCYERAVLAVNALP